MRSVDEPSLEGRAIENLLPAVLNRTMDIFDSTIAGAEIELLVEISGHGSWVCEQTERAPTMVAAEAG